MRLLRFDKTGRLTWEDFSGKAIPPYAILSHRWEDKEVLFGDLVQQEYKNKAGYRKIEFCARQAAQDGLEYFWIDTCCIDKWNLQELSKAINSMFHWYQHAAKCYVFLSDVAVSTATDAPPRSAWEESFRASIWFTRGWTLQELIAPRSVEFFSSKGHRLGDKTSLEQLVHEITSIPTEVLQGCPLEHFSIQERMRWADSRKTTEPEDSAYCLLGILDVSMPASYNEGKDKAWRRLWDELEATSTTLSIIPFARNLHFVGREPQLAELETKLFGDKRTTTIAITGAGGTGKSQLALELAYRTKEKNNNCSVFWIDASDIDSLHQDYLSIAQKLDVPGWDDEKADVTQLVKVYLSEKTARQWLLIFDNADDVNLRSTGLSTPLSTNLIDYLPQSDLGSIILTTTNSDTAKTLAIQNNIELQELSADSAQRMLESYLNTSARTSEKQEMKYLLQELSHLPLAIVQAAAYLKINNKITLKDYQSQLAEQKKDALELSSESLEDKLQDCDIKIPVITTLLVSLKQIDHDYLLASTYLFLAACVDRQDIPLDLLGTKPPREREDAMKLLDTYALVTRRPGKSAFDLHRLVHSTLRIWLRKQKWLGQLVQAAVKCLLKMFPDDNHESRSKWRRLLPHAKYVLLYSLTEQEDENRTNLTEKCAIALYSDGRYDESEELFVRVLETRKTKLGVDHPSTLTSMANLAMTYQQQGRWTEAEQLQIQVMETRKIKLGVDHLATLQSINNLASTYSTQGRWTEAEQLQIQVIETRKINLGADHPDTLKSIHNLAYTYREQGRWTEAEQLQVQTIGTIKTKLKADHSDTLTYIASQAKTYYEQGRWTEAEQLEIQVMETRKTKLGAEHPDTLASMGDLASTYRKQGRWTEAEQLQVQVLKIFKTKFEVDHPFILTSMNNLALIYMNQGRWIEAEQLQVQVMQTRKTKFGIDHPSTLTSMNNLASTYLFQDRLQEAEQLQIQAMETCKTKLGVNHPSTLTSMYHLAITWNRLSRDVLAIQLMTEYVHGQTRILGATHPDCLSSSHTLKVWEAKLLNQTVTSEGIT